MTTGTALVVYESMFGNTRDIAHAIAEGLGSTGRWEVVVREVGQAPTTLAGIDRLVVGAPTHAMTLSNRRSRADAGHQSDRPIVSKGIGVREWLADLDVADRRTLVSAFDTRMRSRLLFGSAAKAISRRLRRRGLRCNPPISFRVADIQGPLVDGELERARHWATLFVPPSHRSRPGTDAGPRPAMSAD